MRGIGNILWLLSGGILAALIWWAGALLFAVTIVGLPLSRAAFSLAHMSAMPFGKEAIHVRTLDGKDFSASTAFTGTYGFIVNIVWACTFGAALMILHLIAGVICCILIIGIPFGIQHFKLAGLSLWPVGRRVVSVEMAEEARKAQAKDKLAKIRKTKVE